MNQYPKRLIEVDLPIKRISAHARREKSIRHGHISTLHIWWARRPLAACRAVICAALWPDPADELCPPAFRDIAYAEMRKWTENRRLKLLGDDSQSHFDKYQKHPALLNDIVELRQALLDFIADFANWDNSTKSEFLETSQTLTQAAHEALSGLPGTRPLVVDPFAGGGSIPLEALRVGADAFASDLNPVAVLLNKVVLEYIPKYGQRLADEVRTYGQWLKKIAEEELAEYYPKDSDGATPIAYLWTRTIISEAPDDGTGIPVEVPLLSSMWLCKKKGRYQALRWIRDSQGRVQTETVNVKYADGRTLQVKRPLFTIYSPRKISDIEAGTVVRGSVTCPVTGYTTPVSSVREQLKKRHGGTDDARLFCVVILRQSEQGRIYRLPTQSDMVSIRCVQEQLEEVKKQPNQKLSLIPDELLDIRGIRHTWAMIYGFSRWGELFMPRQSFVLINLAKLVRESVNKFRAIHGKEFAEAIVTCLALAVDRQADSLSSLTRWQPGRETIGNTFGRQALPMVWDFAEPVPISDSSGSLNNAINWIVGVIETNRCITNIGQASQASATNNLLPNGIAHLLATDPPYYDAVPYSYLSDFFYVWLRRTLALTHSELFTGENVPKDEEIVVDRPHELSNSTHDVKYYETELLKAFAESRRILAPDGIGSIVFASKTTKSWEALLQAVVDAGWIVTGSWPIDTEMASRVAAQGQARLGSSIHLVCRPRENSDGSPNEQFIGDWREVLQQLPLRIHAWLPRLANEGIVGADAIFACLGPALEIFSRYNRVEKASGEVVALTEYLEQVWAAVSKEALTMVFQGADTTGFEEDARLTAMWLWTLSTAVEIDTDTGRDFDESDDEGEESANIGKKSAGGYTLEYDAARKISQGLGAHLEQLPHLIEVKGSNARLFPVDERTRYLFGQTSLRAEGSRKRDILQASLFETLPDAEAQGWTLSNDVPLQAGQTALDRVHQSMLLFAAGRSEALKRFLVDEGVGLDERFWRLGQALSALYPTNSNEKRWIDGVLARKKGLGFA